MSEFNGTTTISLSDEFTGVTITLTVNKCGLTIWDLKDQLLAPALVGLGFTSEQVQELFGEEEET